MMIQIWRTLRRFHCGIQVPQAHPGFRLRHAGELRNGSARFSLVCATVILGLAPLPPRAEAQGTIRLRNVTRETGITFQHSDGSGGRRYIVETVASGLATFDYDGDGLIDIYFLTGTPLQGTKAGVMPTNRLYRNLGGFKFLDVTDKAGVGEAGYGLAVCIGDYNSDGHPDIYLSNYGPNVMFRNNGDGTFSDVTRRTGTTAASKRKVGAGVSFLDADGDGELDLFVANYVDFWYDNHVLSMRKGVRIYPGPERFPPLAPMLFHNNGNGTFTDVSKESGVGARRGPGMGIVCADYNNDGETDVIVGNDGGPGNFLFRNDGGGHFTEVGDASGIAYDAGGNAHGSMGIDCADFDHDGLLDFYVTAYQRQLASLFKNLGGGLFDDVTVRTGAGQGTLNQVKWGCGFVDFDNDGYKDLFIACGHLLDNVEEVDDTTSYPARPVLLRNTGKGTFVDVSDTCGSGLRVRSVGRGAAFDDLDNDGRIDVVIQNSRRPPTILRNESETGNHWIEVQLRGVKTNRDGVGARVKVVAGDLVQIDEVHSGRSYQSHFGSRLHFGLGKRERVDRAEVHWIGGGVDVFENLAVDRLVTLREGGTVPGDCPHVRGGDDVALRTAKGITGGFSRPSPCPLPGGERVQRTVIPFAVLSACSRRIP